MKRNIFREAKADQNFHQKSDKLKAFEKFGQQRINLWYLKDNLFNNKKNYDENLHSIAY